MKEEENRVEFSEEALQLLSSLNLTKDDINVLSKAELIERIAHLTSSYFNKVTERDDALGKEKRLLNTLIDNLPVAVYLKDKKGNKIFVNKSDIQNIGRSKDEILGKSDFDLFEKDLAAKYYEDDMAVLEKGETILNRVEKVTDPYGNEKWLLTSKVPLYDDNNNIEGLIGIGVDISEKKEADDELQNYRDHLEAVIEKRTKELKKANEKLEKEVELTNKAKQDVLNSLEKEIELNKMRSKFISITSHEFKTPLTTILSSSELIEIYLDKNDDVKVHKHIDRIKNTVEYLDDLINDVLLLNRTETGKIIFEPKKTVLFETISSIVEAYKTSLNEKYQIKYNYQINEKKVFLCDSSLLDIALTNLLSNAVKYSPDGGTIRVEVAEIDGKIFIGVSDNGMGIPENELDLIFDQFYRSTNSEFVPGSGLGLTIVKRSVELHNGEVRVESEVNKGSKFTIIIPSEVNFG